MLGGGGGGGGGTVVISSCTGGSETLVVVLGVASLSVFVLVTSNDTETTSAMAAMIAVTPTTHGHLGGSPSSTTSGAES